MLPFLMSCKERLRHPCKSLDRIMERDSLDASSSMPELHLGATSASASDDDVRVGRRFESMAWRNCKISS